MTEPVREKHSRGMGIRPHRLKTVRTNKMWTQHELARHSGISQSMIASMEAGYRDCGVTVLRKLVEALRSDPTQQATEEMRDWLLGRY